LISLEAVAACRETIQIAHSFDICLNARQILACSVVCPLWYTLGWL
jgi:hypothetical protein